MNSPAAACTVEPIALTRGEGEALWFLGSLAMIRSSAATTGGAVAVIEHLSPQARARRCTSTPARTSGST